MSGDDDDAGRIGPTGQLPAGKLHPSDQGGELQFRVGPVGGSVVIEFGTTLSWVGMGPDDARALAYALLESAGHIRDHGKE